jgi:hypothetical protein
MTSFQGKGSTFAFLAVAAISSQIGRAASAGERSTAGTPYAERWVYCSANLQVDRSVDQVIAIIARAKRSGYTGVMLSDYKFQVLYRVPDFYFRNAERVKAAAAQAGLELIPAVFSIGYSNGHLAADPNLAEGLPVIDEPFVVSNRALATARIGTAGNGGPATAQVRRLEAVLDSRPPIQLRNGNLEEAMGDRFQSFTLQDDPGIATFADRSTVHQGRIACRLEPGSSAGGRASPNLRLAQRVALRPHTAYRLSCWVKTRDLTPTGSFHLLALGTGQGGRSLTFHEAGLQSTQDWKQVDVVFNSLDQVDANLYAGFWGAGKGTLWLDELAVEELALVNLLRRPGCPLVVKSADGRITYEEGRDFEPVADPKLGQVPYGGEYEFGHTGATIRLAARSRIKTGDRLRVSWYHPVITHGFQVMCCLSEPKLEEILRDQARRINELFHPKTFFMSHDEIRVANWCRSCQDRKLSPGQLLAENARRCTAILKSLNPKARVVVWSDMFDPQHNAVDNYYLVNGSLKGSWEGLARDVIIANWNGGKARESLGFFADRGHRQIIAGYYDGDDLANFQQWDVAARNVPGVFGFMYTTWQGKYGLMERYGEVMRLGSMP